MVEKRKPDTYSTAPFSEVLTCAVEWLAPGGWLVVEDVYTLPVGSSQYPPMNRYAAAVKQFADIEWGSKIPGLMAKLGLAHIGVETKPRLLGLGGVPDELWRLNLKQVGIQSTLQIFEAVLRV